MHARRIAAALLLFAGSAVPLVAGSTTAAATTTPGGVFVTGHDPDFHAHVGGNVTGARHLLQRAVEFVTFGNPAPDVLLVTSRISPPGGHVDSLSGLLAAGFTPSLASAGGVAGTHDLATVAFSAYDVVIVASDFGGILTQAELDILNARSADVIDYVNAGGGLVALAEGNSGARLTPGGGHFDFLPFLATEVQLNQNEIGYTVTPFGASLGLVDSDVNNNASHTVFTNTGGMQVVNLDAAGRIMSLATRGREICTGGIPAATVSDAEPALEGNPPTGGSATFTVTLDVAPCGGPVSFGYTTGDGTAGDGSDYTGTAGTLTFMPGETVKTVTVGFLPDTDFEADETFVLTLSDPVNGSIADAQGIGVVRNDDSANGAPDCSTVAADRTELWPPDHTMRRVTLAGASDPDGDAVTLTITGVTQDEPVNGLGDGDTGPDAILPEVGDEVLLLAERSGRGDGRVYAVSFTADDGRGGSCLGTVYVGVRHARPTAPVDSGQAFASTG